MIIIYANAHTHTHMSTNKIHMKIILAPMILFHFISRNKKKKQNATLSLYTVNEQINNDRLYLSNNDIMMMNIIKCMKREKKIKNDQCKNHDNIIKIKIIPMMIY